ncbi:MAG: lipoate--protein ligase [Paramuribaculum sp.]|nr:lipoate--protein ligase [Paramuribaculum sp.]
MKYVSLPTDCNYALPFYLAMEEYLARRTDVADDMFFMWRVEPTVIIGRNQDIYTEVNLEYCRDTGVRVYRRKSGGGCVYADMDNVMLSCVMRSDSSVQSTFSRYTEAVASMLQSLGVDARASSRNDITVGDYKVSGSAFYHLPGRSIVHGTMLYDLDIERMVSAITPSDVKLRSNGVESVRSRVKSLNGFLDMSLDDFMAYVRGYLCDGDLVLTADDILEIERLSQPYYNERWIYGSRRHKSAKEPRRVDNAGVLSCDVNVADGVIRDVGLSGDYFQLDDFDKIIAGRLRGKSYEADSVAEALSEVNVGNVICGLTNDELIKLLF